MAYKHYLQISEQRRLLRHRGTYSTQKTLSLSEDEISLRVKVHISCCLRKEMMGLM